MRPAPPIRVTLATVTLAALLAGCGSGGSDRSATNDPPSSSPTTTEPVIDPGDGGDYHPELDPSTFATAVDNPYFPLVPGTRWAYEGSSDGQRETTEVEVLTETREVMGIQATVVRDTVRVDGEVVEDTDDWFAQDADGNVWYLGEDTREYENGEVTSTHGSWEAGVDGALPGIVMPAHPEVGDAFRQEYLEGEAEDLGEITAVGSTFEAGGTTYRDIVETKDWNPLEPDVVERKFYAPGVGLVGEEAIAGADEKVAITAYDPADAG